MSVIVGVDIGGSSIKAAAVDTDAGILRGQPRRTPTPRPATPPSLLSALMDLIAAVDDQGPVGVGFPGVVRHGVAATAANLDASWVGCDVKSMLAAELGGRDVNVVNDADAAGLAEVRFGAAAGHDGLVVVITLGTGIGTAVFNKGVLVPNFELGHLLIDGLDAEQLASGRARAAEGMTWEHWTRHLEAFLRQLERYVWPDMFVIGGGISAEFAAFCAALDTATPVRAATLGNDAGIVGAALAGR